MVAVSIPLTLLMQVPMMWFIYRSAPDLRFGWRRASRSLVRTVFSFSSAVFVIQVSGQLQSKADEIVIGAFLPSIAVTPYALAHKLSDIAQLLSRQFLKVLVPIASVLQGMAKHRRLAISSIGSGLANLGLSLILARPLGGTGVALSILIPTAIKCLVFIMPQARLSHDIQVITLITARVESERRPNWRNC